MLSGVRLLWFNVKSVKCYCLQKLLASFTARLCSIAGISDNKKILSATNGQLGCYLLQAIGNKAACTCTAVHPSPRVPRVDVQEQNCRARLDGGSLPHMFQHVCNNLHPHQQWESLRCSDLTALDIVSPLNLSHSGSSLWKKKLAIPGNMTVTGHR